jgi:hypothetical protein
MRKLLLAIVGLAFAFAISSCNDQGKKCNDLDKCCEEKAQERHHRRW